MSEIKARSVESVSIKSIKPHPKNPNKHTPDQITRLAEIIEYQGFRAPLIVSNQTGLLIAGHGRLAAAKLLEMKEVPVTYQDFADEDQEYAAVVSDNSIASWAELDMSSINAEVPTLGPDFNIDLLGIKDFTLDMADREEGEDEAPEPPKEAKTQRGDLWVLGNHRVMCGDSTCQADVAALMGGEKADMVFTDPPYGISLDVDYAKRYGQKKANDYVHKIAGDYGPDAGIDLKQIIKQSSGAKNLFIWGAENYPDCLPRGGTWTVWDKSVDAVDGIASDFELCWSRERHHYSMIRKLWKGAKAREETGQEGAHRTRWGHPTQKPIELALFFFDHWGKKDKIVCDFFLGSGTTLIACEKTNRRCFGMEIDPIYVDVILARWAKYTGQDPVRQDGVKWSEP